MAHHVVELVLWLLLAFIVGAILGCLVRRAMATGGAERGDDRITGPKISEGYGGEDVMAARGTVAREKEARRAEAEAARRQSEEKAATEAAEEEAARKKAEEKARKAAEEKAAREKAEAEAAKKAAEKEAARKKAEAEAAKKAAESEQAAEAQGLMSESGAGDDAKSKVPLYGLKEPVAGEPDNLQMISGIGPKLEKLLHDLGIYYFAQIARWDEKTIEEIDDKLKFKGRIQRDEWVRQAKLLAEGKLEEFERDYGTGGLKDASGKTRSGARTRRKK